MKTPINLGLFQSDLDASGYKLVNLPIPTASSHAATKGYVDAHAGGGGGGGTNPVITANVKDDPYNAVGDGVTDDTAAIQSAITAVWNLGGGTVFFPRGTYLCNGAFDGSYNSILQIPFNPTATVTNVPLALLGETQPEGIGSPRIKSTKTGTGTAPALLAAGPYAGVGILGNASFNFTNVFINNLTIQTADDPSIHALRLDVACRASLEDVWVQAGTASIVPTHGTVGVWMPNTGNGVQIGCNRVIVGGFDTAFRTGEHFRATDIFSWRNKVGLEFLVSNNGPSWVNMATFQNVTDVKFSGGQHAVKMLLDAEYDVPSANWWTPGTAILDASNYGRGEIEYAICRSGTGPEAGPISISGGNYLSLTDFYTGIKTIAPSGYISASTAYIGTDARLVSISGGVKLEVRNTGTGTWVEATRYTNP